MAQATLPEMGGSGEVALYLVMGKTLGFWEGKGS